MSTGYVVINTTVLNCLHISGDIKLALSHSLKASEPKDLVFVSAASSDANYDVFIRCTDRILYIDGQKGHVTNVEGNK